MDTALKSLADQGMGDKLEIIIQDAHVEPDNGQSDALNTGFSKAKGEWLFWLNADDVLLPGTLEKVARYIECNPSAEWIAGNTAYIDVSGKVIRCAWERGRKSHYDGLVVRTFGPSSFFRHSLFEATDGFDTKLRYTMDTDLWCRFRELGHWYCKLPDYTWGFRVHEGSLTSGALKGDVPPEMEAECRLLDERYGVEDWRHAVRRLRAIRVFDGSYFRAVLDTWRYRGRDWQEVGK